MNKEAIDMNKNMTVGQVVLNNPQVVETLSKLGIDFCCGGDMTLSQAAQEIGIGEDSLLEKLKAIPKKQEGELEEAIDLDSPQLIEYIVDNHHRREEALLNEIDPLLQKIVRVHYVKHGKELAEIYSKFSLLKAELIPHFYQEEKIDFPHYLAGGEMGIESLRRDHDGAGAILDEIEALTQGFQPPADACTTYKLTFQKLKDLADDIHKHVFLENQVLFKREN